MNTAIKARYPNYTYQPIPQTYVATPAQAKIHRSPARFRFVAAGRRFGKTMMAAYEAAYYATQFPDGCIFWVAPVYSQALIGYRMVKKLITPPSAVKSVESGEPHIIVKTVLDNKSPKKDDEEPHIKFSTGATIWFKSAESKERLEGHPINFLVVDEGSLIKDPLIWLQSLRAALTDTHGRALFISRPHGKNWYYKEFLRGGDPDWPEYASFHARSADNPYLDPAEIAMAKRQLPESVFRVQYEAEFLDDAGQVFSGLGGIFIANCEPFRPSGQYVHGIDLGKDQDYTVILTFDRATNQLIAHRRFQHYEWLQQAEIIAAHVAKYPGVVSFDATTYGSVFYPLLKQELDRIKAAVRVIGYWATGSRSGITTAKQSVEGNMFTIPKEKLIQDLQVAVENKSFRIPLDTDTQWLYDEISIFDYDVSSSGRISYNAPDGYHDDGVAALALANQEFKQKTKIAPRRSQIASALSF